LLPLQELISLYLWVQLVLTLVHLQLLRIQILPNLELLELEGEQTQVEECSQYRPSERS
jgi:hypothetical protein